MPLLYPWLENYAEGWMVLHAWRDREAMLPASEIEAEARLRCEDTAEFARMMRVLDREWLVWVRTNADSESSDRRSARTNRRE